MRSFLKFNHLTLFLTATICVILFTQTSSRILPRLELFSQDMFFNLRGPVTPGNEVVIATIDEKSIDTLGRWPWPRSTMANLIDALDAYQAKVIAFDVVFSSPETGPGLEQLRIIKQKLDQEPRTAPQIAALVESSLVAANHDQLLHDALQRSRKAVLGYFFHFSEEGLKHLSEEEMAQFLSNIKKSRYSGVQKKSGVRLKEISLRRAYAVEANIATISDATKWAGYFNFTPDMDGSVRSVPLLVQYRDLVELEGDDDYLFAPLSLTALRKYLKSPILISINEQGVTQVLLAGKDSRIIPVNSLGEMRINYYGPSKSFTHYSISDILAGTVSPENLAGKIVLIGPTATAIEDLRITPFDKTFPGVEVHATIIDNILNNRAMRTPQRAAGLINLATILGAGLLVYLALLRLGPVTGGLMVVLITLCLVGTHYYFFSRKLLVLQTMPPLFEILSVSFSLPIYRYIKQEAEKRFIHTAFSQYLSGEVINQLLKDPSLLKLGGIRKEMTAFFSDVAGFTSISEKLDSEELVKLLNEYLTAMTEIILSYNGTVDKYEGDAIIAFFGAPIDEPEHAKKCCFMALDMQKKIQELRNKWQEEGRPLLHVRMGINTGPMVVGNMGSDQRMDYTIMGDAVNLAARLEGTNKIYGTETIISHFTYAEVQDVVEVRELDSLRVVGKEDIVTIYELLARKGGLSLAQQQIGALYSQGLGFYKAMEWENAVECFSKVIEIAPEDGPSLNYLERCLDFLIRPPGKNWDGVYIMESK